MVLSTDKPQSKVREQWNKSSKIQRQSTVQELMCNIAFDGAHTRRACFLRAVSIFLCHSHDKDWNMEEEMQGEVQGKID